MDEREPIPLSALQHWCYCPRQCALIHVEQVFADNLHTLRGQAVHQLVDQPGFETRAGVRVERALPIWSDRLGLIGKADIVEFERDGSKRGSDTMGMKHRVDQGIYVSYGSINPQLAERTGFTAEDAEAIKTWLPKLFENDASSARPDGSMEVVKVIWWQHESKAGKCSSAKVHSSLAVAADGTITLANVGVTPEIIEGF